MATQPWIGWLERNFGVPENGLGHLSRREKNAVKRMTLLHMDMLRVGTRANLARTLALNNVPSAYVEMLKNRDAYEESIQKTDDEERIRERTLAINELVERFHLSVSLHNIDDESRTITVGEWSMGYEVNGQVVGWTITDIQTGVHVQLADGNMGKALSALKKLKQQKLVKPAVPPAATGPQERWKNGRTRSKPSRPITLDDMLQTIAKIPCEFLCVKYHRNFPSYRRNCFSKGQTGINAMCCAAPTFLRTFHSLCNA